MFEHLCPECGGQLYLWKARCGFQGLTIHPDGIVLSDANHAEITDALVVCGECRWEGPLVFRISDDVVHPGPHVAWGSRRS